MRKIKIHTHTSTYPWMCVAGLFITAPKWKWHTCSLTDKRKNKRWESQTMEYYSAIQRHECTDRLQRGWTLKTLCKVKDAGHITTWYRIPFIRNVYNRGKSTEIKRWSVAAKGLSWRRRTWGTEEAANGNRISFWGDENTLEPNCGDGYASREYTKAQWTVCFKRIT